MKYSQGVQTDELQQVVDGLAASLGRSVAVDDPQLRLLAVSRHFGDEDSLRVRAVMQREANTADTGRMRGRTGRPPPTAGDGDRSAGAGPLRLPGFPSRVCGEPVEDQLQPQLETAVVQCRPPGVVSGRGLQGVGEGWILRSVTFR